MGKLDDRDWLPRVLDEELAGYSPDAARARAPAEALAGLPQPGALEAAARVLVARSLRCLPSPRQDAGAAFLDEVRRHVRLAIDLEVLGGLPFLRARARAEVAALLAAAAGADRVALEVEPHEPGGASDAAVARALGVSARLLRSRFLAPAEPPGGLPIRPGALALFRRRLARVTLGFVHQGRLVPASLAEEATRAAREATLLAEGLAGLLAASSAPSGRELALRVRQVSHLGLPRDLARAARRGTLAPRPPAALAAAAPHGSRPFLLEQLRLAQLRRGLAGPEAEAWLEAFTRGAALEPAAVLASRLEAAAQHGPDDELALAPAGRDWTLRAEEWEAATDQVMEKVSGIVAENLGALATELRETGELGQLLARAAAGHALTDGEWRKVREQLADLAKAVPALAIFAAPGGALILPLLAKLLPFNILPSAWDRPTPSAPGEASSPPAARPRSRPR